MAVGDNRECAVCGASFEARTNKQRNCSAACYRTALQRTIRKSPPTRVCNGCGQVFNVKSTHNFSCSHECWLASKRMTLPDTRNCDECGAVFSPTSALNTMCSKKCIGRRQARKVSEEKRKLRENKTCKECGILFNARVSSALFCCNQCGINYHAHNRSEEQIKKISKNRKQRLNQERFKISAKEIQKLKLRYSNGCAYCGATGYIELDHVIPLSRGGRHSIGNLLPACKPCNRVKQARTVMEWKMSKKRGSLNAVD